MPLQIRKSDGNTQDDEEKDLDSEDDDEDEVGFPTSVRICIKYSLQH